MNIAEYVVITEDSARIFKQFKVSSSRKKQLTFYEAHVKECLRRFNLFYIGIIDYVRCKVIKIGGSLNVLDWSDKLGIYLVTFQL